MKNVNPNSIFYTHDTEIANIIEYNATLLDVAIKTVSLKMNDSISQMQEMQYNTAPAPKR